MQMATSLRSVKGAWLTFWPAWVLANMIGWGLMYVTGLLPDEARLVGTFSTAFVIGLLQWLCLRSFLDAGYIWLPASTIAYGGFLWVIILGVTSSIPFASLPALLLASAAALFALGWLQRYALNSLVHHAMTWVIASPLAAVAAFLAARAVNSIPGLRLPLLFWATLGATDGALTGALLILLKTATKARPAADDSIPPWKRAEG